MVSIRDTSDVPLRPVLRRQPRLRRRNDGNKDFLKKFVDGYIENFDDEEKIDSEKRDLIVDFLCNLKEIQNDELLDQNEYIIGVYGYVMIGYDVDNDLVGMVINVIMISNKLNKFIVETDEDGDYKFSKTINNDCNPCRSLIETISTIFRDIRFNIEDYYSYYSVSNRKVLRDISERKFNLLCSIDTYETIFENIEEEYENNSV